MTNAHHGRLGSSSGYGQCLGAIPVTAIQRDIINNGGSGSNSSHGNGGMNVGGRTLMRNAVVDSIACVVFARVKN
jgi:hypothetical protein